MTKNKRVIIFLTILIGLSLYFYFSNKKGTLKIENSEFAVEDTSAITKIFLADKSNNKVLLERIDDKILQSIIWKM